MDHCFLQVLWTRKKPVPFLLRDLLLTPDITEVLGPTRVSALQIYKTRVDCSIIFNNYPDLWLEGQTGWEICGSEGLRIYNYGKWWFMINDGIHDNWWVMPFDSCCSDRGNTGIGESSWQVLVLRLLVGSVFGLNLRNLAWHGFLTPQQTYPAFPASLIVILADFSYTFQPSLSLEGLQLNFEALETPQGSRISVDANICTRPLITFQEVRVQQNDNTV